VGFKGCDMSGIGICMRSGQGMQTRSLCAGRGTRESAENYLSSLIKGLGKLDKRCKDVRGCAAAAVAVCTGVAFNMHMHGPQGTCRGCNH
jgi:hypothetical protein